MKVGSELDRRCTFSSDRGRHSGFRYELTDTNVGRLLLDSHGARFAIGDYRGFGYYRLVGIYDLCAKRQVFRAQFPIDSDMAISPNGNLLAVRERTQLDIYAIGQHKERCLPPTLLCSWQELSRTRSVRRTNRLVLAADLGTIG